jgi:outer membrane receptor protein involved in Fe transport
MTMPTSAGPQGTLFGRNSTGGLIQVSTKDPKAGLVSGSADPGYANYQTTSGDLYLTGGSDLIAGDVAVKASHLRPTNSTKVTVIFDYADVQFSTSVLQIGPVLIMAPGNLASP